MSRTIIEDRNCDIDVDGLRPLGDYILIKTIKREMTAGGVYLPKNSANELCVGEVVKVGPGGTSASCNRVYPIELVPGDHVFTMGYCGELMNLRSGEYRFVHDHGIWAKVKVSEGNDVCDFEEVWPRFGNLVMEPTDDSMTRSGALYFPNGENKRSECRVATVSRAGPGIWNPKDGGRVAPEVKAGDRVLMVRFAGAMLWIRGKEYRIVNETDIRSGWEE